MHGQAQYTLICISGYLIGSFPTAFLLVKRTARLDIRTSGSGNVGAMNTLDVTGSKMLALVVMTVDAAKGMAAVALGAGLFGGGFWAMGIAGFGALLGHNYSPWIGFKGGRGLATGAGVMLMLCWAVVLLWCVVWTIIYACFRSVHGANGVSSVATPLLLWLAPEKFLQLTQLRIMGPPGGAGWWGAAAGGGAGGRDILLLSVALFSLILLRHVQPLAALWKCSNKQ